MDVHRRRPARIAIAVQGGAANTAFAAGVFRALFEDGVHEQFEIASLSGSSGGAIAAALAWAALLKRDASPWRRVEAFWQDHMAVTPAERAWNEHLVGALAAADAVRIPAMGVGPGSPLVSAMIGLSSRGLRADFTDLRRLLSKHLDFAELAALARETPRPALVIGAVDVLSGRLAKFSSVRDELRVDHLLASCAVPNVEPAVEIGGRWYWDGLFSDNPPVSELIQAAFVGAHNVPGEIWVVKVNPTRVDRLPQGFDAIGDRRAEIVGNLSLFQQLDALRIVNHLVMTGALRNDFLRDYEVAGPVRIPQAFDDEPVQPYHLPFIEPSPELVAEIDYEGKLDRRREHVERLMADGQRQATAFLRLREELVAELAPARSG